MHLTTRELAAVHEAGHAVVGLHYGFKVARVSIEPNEHNGGHVHFIDKPCLPGIEPRWKVRRFVRRNARVQLAGSVAVGLFGQKDPTTGADSDLEMIQVALQLLAPWSEQERHAWLVLLTTQTGDLVMRYRAAIEGIAKELVVQSRISGAWAKRIMREHPQTPTPGPDPTTIPIAAEAMREAERRLAEQLGRGRP